MTTRPQLLSAREALHESIRASEAWGDSYKRNKATFKLLLTNEAKLNTAVAEYLHGLSTRAPRYVDWSQLPQPVQAAANPVFNKDDLVWNAERIDLTAAIIDALTQLVATGGQAGELTYGVSLGITSLSKSVQEAARKLVARLVSGVTDTSRDLIRESIQQSIARGEDITAATERVMKVINNPVRAEMIAQTESVNAYQTGLNNFGLTTGAKTKTWDGLPGACAICSPLIGTTVDINDTFDGGYDFPATHPRCRCGIIYNY